jgi:hypothetical protein
MYLKVLLNIEALFLPEDVSETDFSPPKFVNSTHTAGHKFIFVFN